MPPPVFETLQIQRCFPAGDGIHCIYPIPEAVIESRDWRFGGCMVVLAQKQVCVDAWAPILLLCGDAENKGGDTL